MKVIFKENNKIANIEFGKENSVLIKDNQKIINIKKSNKLFLTVRKIVQFAKKNNIDKFSVNFDDLKLKDSDFVIIGENLVMADYEFDKYKTKKEKHIKEVYIHGKLSKKDLNKGVLIGEHVNLARDLSNTPGGDMTPKLLADYAVLKSKNTKIQTKVLEEKDIKKLKMGGVLGVAKGSIEKPKFVVMEYLQGTGKPIVLVGKGVTFDTGGINLKPSAHILDMQMDMSGASAVINTILLVDKLKLKKNVIALIPSVENMPSGASYRPGDILTMMSGITVEVKNTDAEGRLILADALCYAKKYNPKLVIDVATLTGSAPVALGERITAMFTKKDKIAETLYELGIESGDYVWRMPLWDEYKQDIKGTFADICNTSRTRYGGCITAAMFLYEFAKDYPWVHLDIAPTMTTIPDLLLSKGAGGAPVRLLQRFIENNK